MLRHRFGETSAGGTKRLDIRGCVAGLSDPGKSGSVERNLRRREGNNRMVVLGVITTLEFFRIIFLRWSQGLLVTQNLSHPTSNQGSTHLTRSVRRRAASFKSASRNCLCPRWRESSSGGKSVSGELVGLPLVFINLVGIRRDNYSMQPRKPCRLRPGDTIIRKNQEKERSRLATWMQHPENLWVRRAFFQIHLWVGAGVASISS